MVERSVLTEINEDVMLCYVMCLYWSCAAADTIVTVHVSLLGEPGAVCLQYAAWRPVSSCACFCALRLTAQSSL